MDDLSNISQLKGTFNIKISVCDNVCKIGTPTHNEIELIT